VFKVPVFPSWMRAMRKQLHQSQWHSRTRRDEHERAHWDWAFADDDRERDAQADKDFKRIENS
jgi:hypothetical protein